MYFEAKALWHDPGGEAPVSSHYVPRTGAFHTGVTCWFYRLESFLGPRSRHILGRDFLFSKLFTKSTFREMQTVK